MTEGKHLGRTIRCSPQGFEWESNSKHVTGVEGSTDADHEGDGKRTERHR